MIAVFSPYTAPQHPTEMSAPPSSAPTPTNPAPTNVLPCPSPAALVQAARLAMAQDSPIRLDYYADSSAGTAFMGEDGETKEKMLVKSTEEFTSLIQKTYKVGEDYIVQTENSVYIVSCKLQKRRIQANSLRNEAPI